MGTPKRKSPQQRLLWLPAGIGILLLAWWALPQGFEPLEGSSWQRMASPGELSSGHAWLEADCAACHTSIQGVETSRCIVCHATDEILLGRQPTAFHAGISTCRECHPEHRGRTSRASTMQHDLLARIGLRQLRAREAEVPDGPTDSQRVAGWIRSAADSGSPASPRRLSAEEMVLDCFTCHANDDRHFRLFGQDCAGCHATTAWSLPEYRHPSTNSTECSQCHQAPPSHYMMHFSMISARVAGQPRARVDQCFLCHQTTSWPDIRRAGWYKHH